MLPFNDVSNITKVQLFGTLVNEVYDYLYFKTDPDKTFDFYNRTHSKVQNFLEDNIHDLLVTVVSVRGIEADLLAYPEDAIERVIHALY